MSGHKLPVYVTPPGKYIFPKLTKPDTKFIPDGIYDVKIVLEPSIERDKLLKEIVDSASESLRIAQKEHPGKKIKSADVPFVEETDDNGTSTGNMILHAKMKARIVPKDGSDPWTQKPALFDSRNHPIDSKSISPWTGTIGRISFEIVPYYSTLNGPNAGVTLRLKAAQILKLVEGKGRSAEDYGFEQEEDGFNAETIIENGTTASPEEPDDGLPF